MASRFQWTDSGAQSFITDLKVQTVTPKRHRPAMMTESIDGSVVEAVVIGDGYDQAEMAVRHEADITSLRYFASVLRRRLSITFTPDNDVPGTTYTVTAVGAVPDPVMETEGRQNLYALGPFTLRRLDGGTMVPV